MDTYTAVHVTIEVPEDIVEAVVTTHRAALSGAEPDEYAAYLVIAEWLGGGNTDLEHEIVHEILMPYNLPWYRD